MKLLTFKLIGVLAVTGGATWLAAGSRDKSDLVRPLSAYAPAPRQPLLGPDETYHGLAWQIHSNHECVKRAHRLFGEIADLGADTVLISNAGYQEHAGSESFHLKPPVSPSEAQWQEIFGSAHDNGLRVILMPIILLSDPRGTEWRGVIKPPNWDDWFDAYLDFVLHFARLAQRGDVEVLMVGSELISTERFTDRWRSLIRKVRQVYHGKLSYSGNWDHYKVVEFWNELDLIGMTSYYKLSEQPSPSLASLIQEWKPIKQGVLRWQRAFGKPLLFTEVGWCSQEGASIEPWNYYYNQYGGKGDHPLPPEAMEEQRRCYRAFMETWRDTPEVGGGIWWEWNDGPGGEKDFNYTPKGKPAEAELRNWFAAIRRTRLTASQPAARP